MALAELIIKYKLGINYTETVEQIKDNPYLQYFIGMSSYIKRARFDTSMLVHFPEIISGNVLNKVNQMMVKKIQEATFEEADEKKKHKRF
ncbi:hypothetical protein RintRC_7631 [Richelia intracellularis]|nr:hypothetical protein RintRC_7631 [Richelia intracellularis]